jgi:dephospho-CoA kinase
MLKIGLTGGVSSGKSTAGKFFSELGAAVLDADAIVEGLYRPGAAGTREVEKLFGSEFLDRRHEVDRQKLARKVFADPAARRTLESSIHPLVMEEIRRWFGKSRAKGTQVAVVEASQIFEGGYEKEFDRVLLVVSPEIVRMKRWREDGLSGEELARRMAAQIVENEARRKADDIVVNAGTLADLRTRIEALFQKYREFEIKENPPVHPRGASRGSSRRAPRQPGLRTRKSRRSPRT